MAPRKPGAPKAATLPTLLPSGLVVTDLVRRTWRLGSPIGSGGFGQIYSASAVSDALPGSAAGAAQYVIKVEAHASGPLFSEMHCYHRVARAETIAAWQKARGLKRFGMPRFIASGSFVHGNDKFRFMVIERFGDDLQKLLERNHNRFPMPTILHIGIQVLDVLEFIHSQGYIHGDIKGQNLLLGLSKDTKDLVYLVDFGLACRYSSDGVHKEYKPDVRKAHNGTIEFTSRDAHIGAQSRRGDLEILGYNLLQWASGTLPWMDRLQSAEKVAAAKNRMMANVPALVKACFTNGLPKGSDAIQRFLAAVAALRFEEKPDYDALRVILQAGLKSLGNPPVKLVFTTADMDVPRPQSSGRARDRSPLQPVQESIVPRRRPAAAAAKKPGRGRSARVAAAVVEENGVEAEEEEGVGDEPQPLVNGRGRKKGGRAVRGRKRTSEERLAEDGEEPEPGCSNAVEKRQKINGKDGSARSSTVTNSTSNGSIYNNINAAMQEVLDRRAKAGKASKAKPATAKLKPKSPTAAASRARGRGRSATAAAAGSRGGRAAGAKTSSPAKRTAGRRVASPPTRSARSAISEEDGVSDESFHTPSGSVARRRSVRLSGEVVTSPLARPRRPIRNCDFSPELW